MKTAEASAVALPQGALPHAVRWATYNGDATHMATNAEVVGPNTTGELLVAVIATFDEVRDSTRVGFAYVPQGSAS